MNYVDTTPLPTNLTSDAVVPATGGVNVQTGEGASIVPSGALPAGTTESTTYPISNSRFPFPPRPPYTLSFPAGRLNTRDLDVQRFELVGNWSILFEPLSFSIPVPTGMTGTIPQNGQNAVGSDITATFIGCDGRTATLVIDYGNGFTLQQTRTITDDKARFRNLTTDSTNVPGVGVETVRLTVGAL
ncbi:MAG: hypothetical protein ACO1SV_08430 [Fimbriimonas sp.]